MVYTGAVIIIIQNWQVITSVSPYLRGSDKVNLSNIWHNCFIFFKVQVKHILDKLLNLRVLFINILVA